MARDRQFFGPLEVLTRFGPEPAPKKETDSKKGKKSVAFLRCLVMLSMFQGYASMVGPLQSAYKHRLGISTDGTDAAHAFTQAAVGVHYGKLIARLGHNVIFACLSPWTRVVIATLSPLGIKFSIFVHIKSKRV